MLPLVVIVQHNEQGSTRHFAFADSPVRVGRSPFAELQLSEEFVSRWEGTVRFDDNQVTYFNLSATNPTFVNGRQAAQHEEIQVTPETVIAIGQLTLRFVRMPVPESDLRRRGKRAPVVNSSSGDAKTVWLGAAQPADGAKPASERPAGLSNRTIMGRPPAALERPGSSERPAASERPVASERPAGSERPLASEPPAGSERPAPSTTPSRPPPAARDELPPPSPRTDSPPVGVTVRAVQSVAVGRTHLVTASVAPATSTPSSSRPTAGASEIPPTSTTNSAPPRSVAPLGQGVEALHESYRAHWDALLVELTRELEGAPEEQRASLADRLQRSYPQITQEPGFRALLKRLGLSARKPDIPEISEWLRTIAEGVLPPQFKLDTGLTLERILGLLEILGQSIAEINDAQDSVRKRWLGRAPRGSVLQSDNGRVILAYLLNPRADWNDRVSEVEESLRNVVMHEIALFKATLEGAKALLEALSPETLAEAEQIDLASLDDEGGGMWKRLTSRDEPRAALWKRFVSTYESLKDGARYQRVFMGRPFARTYLAAMGQADAQSASASDTTQPMPERERGE